jgi:hypothetical protein
MRTITRKSRTNLARREPFVIVLAESRAVRNGGLRFIWDRGGTPRISRDHGRIRRYEKINSLIFPHAKIWGSGRF